MGEELSLDIGSEEAELVMGRHKAVALYQDKEQLKGWDDQIIPAKVLESHIEGRAIRGEFRRSMSSWMGLLAAGVMMSGLVWALGSRDLKIGGYFTGLFGPKNSPGTTDLTEYPIPLDPALAPVGLKDRVEEVNAAIRDRKWLLVVEEASDIANDEESLNRFRTPPEAFTWLYELLTAGKMALDSRDYAAIVGAADEFKTDGGKPSFAILYNQALARFEAQGGDRRMEGGGEQDFQVLKECAYIEERFGDEVLRDRERSGKIRKVRMFSLIRILDIIEDLDAFTQTAADGKTYAEHWQTLHSLTELARGDFPQPGENDQVEKEWKTKPKDHLRCEEWFWRKIEGFEPYSGTEVRIGNKVYDGDDAEYNNERIKEALQ
ncbi:hypothetical protein [Haloferula sp.]|uniref:hypothetical protein n=1 Tax=Haloferula sp. TaxID=2497595 RepID=UPI0032A06923